MNYTEYQQLFETILHREQQTAPYDDPFYLHYTKLNQARMRRWDKQLKMDDELVDAVKAIRNEQHWVIIAEPWCGDAAHTLPLMIALTELTEAISYDIQLRDSEPFLINDYLTGSAKSIPKLIVRAQSGQDIFVWGPRPVKAQGLFNELKSANAEHTVIAESLQQWYNQDKGQSFFQEITQLLVQNLTIIGR